MDENMAKAYRIRHQQACLVAYNALEEAWPPDNATEYWEKTANRYADIYNECASNPLAKRFMTAVYNYLGTVVKHGLTAENWEQYNKQAFRIALDLLNGIFKDCDGVVEQVDALKKVGETSEKHMDNPLCIELMKAVRDYIPDAVKEMEEAS